MEKIVYKKILVPYDFKPEFLYSLKIAEEIATTSGASITLLYPLVSDFIMAGPFPSSLDVPILSGIFLMPDREKALKDLIKASGLPAGRFEIKIVLGRFFQSIVSLHDAVPHDLIVVPDFNHKTGLKSTGELNVIELMKKVKAPVISVNKALDVFNIHTVLLPIRNVKEWFDKVPFTIALAGISQAKIIVLALAENHSDEKEIRTKLSYCEQYLLMNYNNFEIEKTHIGSEPYVDALDVADRCGADLISVTPPATGRYLRSSMDNRFYSEIINRGRTPVFGVIR